MKVEINGVCYVPAVETAPPEGEAVREAVRVLLMWLYLRDKPDGAVWGAIDALSPDLHALAGAEGPDVALDAIGGRDGGQ